MSTLLYTVDYNNTDNMKTFASSRRASSNSSNGDGSYHGLDYDNTKYNNIKVFANARTSDSSRRASSTSSNSSYHGLDYDNAKYNKIKEFANARASNSSRRTSSGSSNGEGSYHGLDYDNTKYNNIKAFANARASDSSESKFSMQAALDQLKPTEKEIAPSGIYSPIIKRGSLFSGLRSKKGDDKVGKHSHTQAGVDATLLR